MNKEKENLIRSEVTNMLGNNFNILELIAESKFGNSKKLISKFYQSIIDGYINVSDLISDDETILNLKNYIENYKESEKEKIMKGILDIYKSNSQINSDKFKKYNRMSKN